MGYARFFEAVPEAPSHEIYSAASLEVARAAARLRREEGLLVVGLDLAGQEKGYPAQGHRRAYQVAHEAFLGKTVHAGEDYGPESIFQAIGDLHADRIGHGTWLFDERKITSRWIEDRRRYIEDLSEFIADKRITIEVCLTSNQQTVPELADDLHRHPFGEMRAPPALHHLLHGQPPRLPHHGEPRGRDAPSRPSTSPTARCATSSSTASSGASSRAPTWRRGATSGRSSTSPTVCWPRPSRRRPASPRPGA